MRIRPAAGRNGSNGHSAQLFLPFLPRVRHLRCRRRLELLLLLPDKFRMLIPSFQLFRAAAETALARSFSFSRRLSRFDSDRGRKGRRGRGNFPSHPYSVKPARSRGRTRTERESKCRFFGRRQSSGFLSSAKLASINGASGGGRPIELTAAKAEAAATGHGRLSISRIVPSFLPSFPICPLGQSQSEVRLGHLSAHFGVADILSRISSMSFYEVSSHHNEALHSTSSTRSFFLGCPRSWPF